MSEPSLLIVATSRLACRMPGTRNSIQETVGTSASTYIYLLGSSCPFNSETNVDNEEPWILTLDSF